MMFLVKNSSAMPLILSPIPPIKVLVQIQREHPTQNKYHQRNKNSAISYIFQIDDSLIEAN